MGLSIAISGCTSALAPAPARRATRVWPAAAAVTDQQIVASVLAGRREEFSVLVERYQRMLYRFAYGYLKDADAADDAVQVTFVRAYTHLAQFRGPSTFKAWLCQIALNVCRARSRRMRARREVSLDVVSGDALIAPGDGATTRAERSALE